MAARVKSTSTGSSRAPLGRGQKLTIEDLVDPTEDYDVPHNGTVPEDSATGQPDYDEAAIAGGHFIQRYKVNGKWVEEHVNARGKKIDPDTGSPTKPADILIAEDESDDDEENELDEQ